jgi:hypothetical protein
MVSFPFSYQKHERIPPLNIYCKNLIELQEVKLTKAWNLSPMPQYPAVFNSQDLSTPRLWQFVN